MSKKPKTTNAFTQAVNEALAFLRKEVLAVYLVPFKSGPPLMELFVFGDLSAIRGHIMGAPRAALHTGLHNPQAYLQVSADRVILMFVFSLKCCTFLLVRVLCDR